MTIDERVTAFMEAHGYKFCDDSLGTRGYAKIGMPPVEVETAIFMYRLHLEARRDELLNVSNHLSFDDNDRYKDADAYIWIWQERCEEINKLIAETQ